MTPDVDQTLLNQFVTAFETADIQSLSLLFRRDVELEMPPIPTWFAGRDAVCAFFEHRVLAGGSRRLVPIRANGCPGVATYVGAPGGQLHAHSIQVLETEDGEIAHIYAFREPELFAAFGLPQMWPDND